MYHIVYCASVHVGGTALLMIVSLGLSCDSENLLEEIRRGKRE